MRGSFLVVFVALAVAAAGSAQSQSPRRPQYEVVLPAEVDSAPGQVKTVSLTIAARPGFSISHDGPLVVKLAVAPEAGIRLPKKAYRREDAADARADNPRFDLLYAGQEAGEYRLTVSARFWVCTRRTCRPVREDRDVLIRVAEREPPPDAGAELDASGA